MAPEGENHSLVGRGHASGSNDQELAALHAEEASACARGLRPDRRALAGGMGPVPTSPEP
eukprot:6143959-Heterocapsa_arctica.AAC.1